MALVFCAVRPRGEVLSFAAYRAIFTGVVMKPSWYIINTLRMVLLVVFVHNYLVILIRTE